MLHATSVLQKRELTWWNGEKRNRGVDVAMALPWDEVKRLMTEEFCPRNEVKKLEAEFWDLAQDSGENLAYTTRFHELSLLVPHMVTPLSRCIEKYIGGLPRKRKTRNYAVVTPAILINQAAPMVQAPAKKPYVGIYPLCATCNYHHPQSIPCRLCTYCGRYGHTVNVCRTKALAGQVNPPNQTNTQVVNQGVPAIANGQGGARGRAFNINANNDVVNGTFLINSQYASILFDTGADKSFVSLNFEPLLAKTPSQLEKTFTVEVANGDSLTIESIIYDCSLELNDHTFPINLVPMPLGSFDIIIGMD
ncbi:hypothetical protein L1987_60179 [Smallanthus sonchifolius]|uniref:Uncharacterized protein n=1 Tax=Smallanthus sonchifolius TaxID=185202 RepID=A0ACB9D7K0_9ASTR|nr:hypothetical protein L1987_60179 [Smallanthus sonchifolius]